MPKTMHGPVYCETLALLNDWAGAETLTRHLPDHVRDGSEIRFARLAGIAELSSSILLRHSIRELDAANPLVIVSEGLQF